MPPARALSVFGRLKLTAPPLWLAVVLPLGYFTAAVVTVSLLTHNTPIWISNSFVLTALLRNRRSTWPALLCLFVLADYAQVVVTAKGMWVVGLGIVVCDLTEILLVATLSGFTETASLEESVWPIARLALVSLLVPMITATGGAALLNLALGVPFGDAWENWYLATASGLVIVTPLLLCWTDRRLRTSDWRRVIPETLLLAGLVAIVGYLDFHDAVPGLFLVFPFLLLTTFQGRLLGATTAAAAVATVAIWSTFTDHGPIATFAGTSIIAKIQYLQLYIAVVLLSALPLAAVLGQREKLAAQLRETTRAAQEATRAKSEFLAVMSHEIRTPMTGVLGMTDLLMQAPLPAKQREYVARIRASGRHLLALINDILDFSRIEAGKIELEAIDFSITDVLEQVGSLLTPLAVERGLELRFEADDHAAPRIRGDPTRLRQVLINLVGNGIKFTRRGGVTVTVSHRTMADRRERFHFEVRDTGIGIPEERRKILFDPFSQADSSTTRRYGGSGLGLAISRRLVEAMEGEIGVDSVEGVGSCFWFELPLTVSEGEAPRETPAPRVREEQPRRVLLAEDVEMNQVLVADMLRAHGHDVVTAANGQEALELAAREAFDVVLMDVQMPVMDGVEATVRIRQLPPPACNVPVLALSANVMAEDMARYKAAGMNGALTKPIDWPKLFEALAQHGSAGRTRPAQPAASMPPTNAAPSPAEPVETSAEREAEISVPVDLTGFDRRPELEGMGSDLKAKLAGLFVRDNGKRLEELRDAVHRADIAAVARLAHAIKGSAANLGARQLAQLCADIETRAEAAEFDLTSECLDGLQREFTRACAALTASRNASTGNAVAAMIAHEIKQPLTGITTHAQAGLSWLDRPEPEIDEAREAFRQIAANVLRTGQVIDTVRTAFPPNAQSRISLAPDSLIADVLACLRADLRRHRISVHTESGPDLPAIAGDPTQLRQVIVNLVTNAIDAMAETTGPRILSVYATFRDGSVRISVADSGPGIRPEDADRIFNPLFTTKPDGIGMGLAICRSIIEDHDGRIWIAPNTPQGAVLHIALRAAGAGPGLEPDKGSMR
jgi:signal transduction histidine kinase/ActR/RegA family two-component response regulator